MKTEATNKEIKMIDASGKTLGRLASEVAQILLGKNKPSLKKIYGGTPVNVLLMLQKSKSLIKN